jgi:hypothetical protein
MSMPVKMRRWQRDLDVEAAVTRWPLTNSHIARLCGFPSVKKAAERTNKHFQAGLLKRVPFFHPGMQGKPEFLYGVKHAQFRERTMLHDHRIAELHVLAAAWLRTVAWDGAFYYTHEALTSGGIIQDATLILENGTKHSLIFFEVDNGTETVTGNGAYSLAKKLQLYAAYFDSDAYARDFATAGTFRGFRVCMIVPTGRLPQVQRLIAREQHDFVLITSFDRLKEGFGTAIWTTSENASVDLLGRRGELIGEMVEEIVEQHLPRTVGINPCTLNDLRRTRAPETTVIGQEEEEGLA